MAAAGSNSGKTTIACALLGALKNRGLDPLAFKCGPDYIDPLFHKKVLGIESRNLDSFFSGAEGIRAIADEAKDRYVCVEGVMGIYDGMSADDIKGSCYEIACILNAPVILVVDASGAGRTIISVIKGILLDDPERLIKGIILNKISAGFYEKLKPVLEKELHAVREDVRLFGAFPKAPGIKIDSRHLGLTLPHEIDDIRERISEAAALLEEHVDVDGIIEVMEKYAGAGNPDGGKTSGAGDPCAGKREGLRVREAESGGDLTLAVAYDEAFCFYYTENLELFRKNGVELRFFSPIRDTALPEGCDGILLGGGYPENYLSELAGNKTMLTSIRTALERGVPSLAECGGFMYLHKWVEDTAKNAYEMVGAVDGRCFFTGQMVRFGYLEIEAVNLELDEDEMLKSLVGMRGHEFHYYESTKAGDMLRAVKPDRSRSWDCAAAGKNGIWGFPHFYYGSDPLFVRKFSDRMREVKNG